MTTNDMDAEALPFDQTSFALDEEGFATFRALVHYPPAITDRLLRTLILAIKKEAQGLLLDGLLVEATAVTNSNERPKAGLAKSKARPVVPGSAVKVPAAIDEAALLGDLRTLVQSARQRIATAAYSTQTLLGWRMGRRLASEHLQGGRAAYGKQILVKVSRELTADYDV